jgi:CRISPR system Cascade subunit CasA
VISVLADPILSLRDRSDAVTKVTLPGLFAALMADEVQDLPALRPHQRQPMHAFLAQLGALALHRAGETKTPNETTAWTALLRGLTPDFANDEPWSLVVSDIAKPALLQPPIPEGMIDALKETEDTPDALDMLVTAKNHDVKSRRLVRATPEHWFAALLTLQTLEGFLGNGNYGISRMNGGFASRPMVSLVPEGGMGARLKRDILCLLARRSEPENEGYMLEGGKALLWLDPWDGTSSLRVDTLDPWYIEICRRIRLVNASGKIIARRATTRVPRVDFPKDRNGVTGDPWTPVKLGDKTKGEKTLTLQGSGFGYQLVSELLDPKSFRPAPLQWWRKDDGSRGLSLVMTGLARGQGETAGFHERRIPLPGSAVNLLGKPGDRYAEIARQRVDDAGTTRRAALRTALFVLFQNAPESLNLRHAPSETKSEPFLTAFDRRVDAIFFESIPAELEAAPEDLAAAREHWLEELLNIARAVFDEAATSVPLSGLRRYHTIEAARSTLEATFRNRFHEKAAERT